MDIEFPRKTDASFTFQYYEQDGTTKRALTGATVFFTAKENQFDSDVDDSDAAFKTTITSHTDAANGLTTISLTHESLNVDPKNYFYDIRVKESDGKVYQALTGRCRITAGSTNRTT